MITRLSLRRILGVCTLVGITSAAQAVVQMSGVSFTPRSGISMQITGAYDNLPKTGYVPLRITIKNGSPASREWAFRFISQSGYQAVHRKEYQWKASVDARSEQAFDLLVPLVSTGTSHGAYPSLQVRVSGYGVDSETAYYAANYKYSGHRHSPFTGLSSTLAVSSMGPLEKVLNDQSTEFTGCRVDTSALSSDWRAYLGFATLWLSGQDWDRVGAGARAAILEWVAHGGRLMLCTRFAPGDPSLDRLGVPGSGQPITSHGLGRIEWVTWDGTQLDPALAATKIQQDASLSHGRQIDEGYQSAWGLRRLVPDAELNAPLIVLAMIGFAIVVGPVNLILFAGKRRRHRLFVTTPIISVVASFALVLIILIQDGLGGEGGRVALRYLMPESHRELIIQEQVARTGMLLASRFDLPELDHCSQLNLGQDQDRNRSRSLIRTETTAEGDWFTSRSVQAHYLSRIAPSRARVEVLNPKEVRTEGAPPVLLSSLEQPLRDVVYIDHQGRYWATDLLPVGARTPLTESTHTQFRHDWWQKQVSDAGLRIAGLSDRLAFLDGHVYGVAQEPGDWLIDTHGQIEWKREHVIVVGPVLGQEGA